MEGGGREFLCSTTYVLRDVHLLVQCNYKNGCTKSACSPVFSRTATVARTREKQLVDVLVALLPARKLID